MNYNYEEELNRLKEAQKQAAIADLDKQKNQSLSDLQAEESKIKPIYYKKRDTANTQNQIAAKNFHEYLVNSGRSNSGIGAQYEMARQNTLQKNLNELNTQEAADIADINRRRTDVNNAYTSGLSSANAEIEANYIQNLLNERQKAWERQQAEKEFNESVRQFNAQLAASRARSSGSPRRSRRPSSPKSKDTTAAVNNLMAQLDKLPTPKAGMSFVEYTIQKKNAINNAYKNGQITANDVKTLSERYNL